MAKKTPLADIVRRKARTQVRLGNVAVPNILEYFDSDWGLNREGRLKLYPVQRVILKLFYNIPLDGKEKVVEVKDMFNTKVLYHFTEVEYLAYLHSEGRCNIGVQDFKERRTLVLPIGRRSGKCVRGDTLVPTDRGLVRIDSLGDPSGPEIQPLCVNVRQMDGSVAETAWFYSPGEQPIRVARTHLGLEVTGTDSHRVKVMQEDGTIGWKPMSEIKAGDWLAVYRGDGQWGHGADLSTYAQPRWSPREIPFTPPSSLDLRWARLLGYLTGDGCWKTNTRVDLTAEVDILEDAEQLFIGLFGTCAKRVVTSSRPIRHFLDWCGFRFEAIPWVIMESPKEIVCEFLRGLFETGGGVEKRDTVTFSTASKQMGVEVQALLLNLGIVSKLSPKIRGRSRAYWTVRILGLRHKRRFQDKVGFISARKRALLIEACSAECEGVAAESLPHQRQWCSLWVEQSEVSVVCLKDGTFGSAEWSRSVLRDYLGNTINPLARDELTYSRLRRALEDERFNQSSAANHLRSLLDLDLYWDRVESVDDETCPVFDVSMVDSTRPEFVAGGVVNHNSFLSAVIASYETYRLLHLQDPYAHYGLDAGIPISIVCLASDKKQAGIIFKAAHNHYLRVPFFSQHAANDTQSYCSFQTAKDIELGGRWNTGRNSNAPTSIEATFQACQHAGVRGYGNLIVILDEFAHFRDASNKANSALVFDAVTPSTATFSPKDPKDSTKPLGTTDGRIMVISSPWVRSGKFYELFDQAFRGGDAGADLLVVQAPTWEVNPTIDSGYLRTKYYSNPDSFMVEFGAQFAESVKGWIERKEDLIACIDTSYQPQTHGRPNVSYYFGIDLGVSKGQDGSAVTISHVDPDYQVVIDYHEAVYAGEPLPQGILDLFPSKHDWSVNADKLDFDDLAKWVYFLTKRFRVGEGMFDQWMGIAFEQLLVKRYGVNRIKMRKIKPTERSEMFQTFKVLMYDQRLVICNLPQVGTSQQSALVSDLLNLEARFVSRNVIDVKAPDMRGYHDDRPDSAVRSIWLASQRIQNTKKASRPVLPGGAAALRYDVVRQQMRSVRRSGMMPMRSKRLAIMRRLAKRGQR